MDSILKFTPQAVVVDAGEFPVSPVPLGILSECHKIVCCDGAANSYIESGRHIWRIVGDCDSLLPKHLKDYADIIRRNPDQETNDQTKAVRYLKRHGITKIAIVAATGRREDHTLGNISLLMDYLMDGVEARIYTDYGVFIPVCNRVSIECHVGSQVSVFNFGANGFTSQGLKYPLYDFSKWWQGTLNETTESVFTIEANGYFLIFVNYPFSRSESFI